MILHVFIAMVAGWLSGTSNRSLPISSGRNRGLKADLDGRRLRSTDTERRRLAALAHPLGRKRLNKVATLVTQNPPTVVSAPDCPEV